MVGKRKLASAIFVLFFLIFSVYADLPEDVVKRHVESIKTELNEGNVEKAFERTNVLLRSFENPDFFPAGVTFLSQQVYEKYLSRIEESAEYGLVEEVESNLQIFPGISSSSLKVKAAKIKNLYELKKEDENSLRHFAILKSIKGWLACIFAGLLILAAIIFVPVVIISKKSRMQIAQLDTTLKAIAGMQQQNNQILLGGITDLSELYRLKSAGSSRWGTDALPAPEMSIEDKSELKELAVACEQLGREIDDLTGRKNNSKNVSELVYKLALSLGLNQNSAMVYFCAAMVYDAGFKSLPEELLAADNLNEEQKNLLKVHVEKNYGQFLKFVPKKYELIFEEAVRYHHENMDGSGYPDGLSGNGIPQIARLIRVAESFNSLCSHRNYKEILDKESAISELLARPDLYDTEVVKTLDSIV